jgi:CHAT domain-containing protein/tetratricopeptide (TPR) repeat protein
MARRVVHRVMQAVLIATVWAGLAAQPLRAQSPEEVDVLAAQVQGHINAGRYVEAVDTAQQALALAERVFGPDHVRTAYELFRLGNTMRFYRSDFAAAHPHLLRALVILEREAAGQETLDVARTLRELGWTSVYTLRLADAQQYFSRSLAMEERLLGVDNIEVAYLLDGLALTNVYASQYEAAERYGERALEIKKKRLEPGHDEIANTLNQIAIAKFRNGKIVEAEELFHQVLDGERAKPQPDIMRIADINGLLAIVAFDKGDYVTSEQLVTEVVASLESNGGTDRGTYFSSYNLIAKIQAFTNRFAEAEQSAKKVIQAFGAYPVVHARDVMDATNTLSIVYTYTDRYSDAEQVMKRAIAIAEDTFGEVSVDVAVTIENLAFIYATVGRSAEALELFKRILSIRNKILPPGHALIGSTYANRARVLNRLSRFQEAEADAREGIRILEAVYGDRYPMALATRDELGTALKGLGRYDEAVQVYKDAIAVTVRAEGSASARIPTFLHNMGLVLDLTGRYPEAEDAFLRSIAAKQAGTVIEAQTRKVLADLYVKMGRQRDARENYRLATAVFVDAFTRTAANRREYEGGIWLKPTVFEYLTLLLNSTDLTPAERQAAGKEGFEIAQWLLRTTTSTTLSQVGARYAAGSGALAQSVRARQDGIQRWEKLSAQLERFLSQPIADRNQAQAAAMREQLEKLEATLAELDRVLAEQFPAYTELSSPRPIGIDELQGLLRPDEVLVQFVVVGQRVAAWFVSKQEVVWYPVNARAEEIAGIVTLLRCGLDYDGAWRVAGSRCAEVLNVDFTHQDHKRGKLLPFDIARAHVLYKVLFGGASAMIQGKKLLVVPSGGLTQLPLQVLVESVPANIASGEQTREVALLGVEFTDLTPETRQQAGFSSDGGVQVTKIVAGGPAEKAGLKLGDIVMSVAGRHVSGTKHAVETIQAQPPLSQARLTIWRQGAVIERDAVLGTTTLRNWLPLYVDARSVRKVAWLARSHVITVLPSASSLKALRQHAKTSQATKSFLGIGNPLLDGPDSRYVSLRDAARKRQRCGALTTLVAAAQETDGEPVPVTQRGGIADVASLRKAPPLPETADELCDVAKVLGAKATDVLLGERASEGEMVKLNEAGTLRDYRIVHFATHGALAGEVSGSTEPGLLLTPPAKGSEADDGYLSASEIAGLRLDADWVVLSACNTASGEAEGAQALSGLARSFFYAGARALLVSHWYVDSKATVALINNAFAELNKDPTIGRAEALNRSMLALIERGTERQAHPAAWAPFVLVGEGAAGR